LLGAPGAFVVQKKKKPILFDRAAQRASKDITDKLGSLVAGVGIGERAIL
jgi:hypothetical protein